MTDGGRRTASSDGRELLARLEGPITADDLERAERAVASLVRVPLGQAQFDALVSFVRSVGAANFAHSTLLKELNKGHTEAVPVELARWNQTRDAATGRRVTDPALARRRQAEIEYWRTGQLPPGDLPPAPGGSPTAPSPHAKPAKESFEGKPGKEGKEAKDGKEGKDTKDSKEGKDTKDSKDGKDGKEGKETKDSKDGKEGKEAKDSKEGKDTKDSKDSKDAGKESKDGKDVKDYKDGSDGKTSKDGKDFKDSKDGQDNAPSAAASELVPLRAAGTGADWSRFAV